MGISIISTIVLTAYVACPCSTNRKTDPYKSPALKLKKSSKPKQSQAITINHTGGLTRQKSTKTVNTLLEIIKRTLESGEDVLISGFGKFCVKDKKKRRGRNPATGDDMMLRPRRVVTFKC